MCDHYITMIRTCEKGYLYSSGDFDQVDIDKFVEESLKMSRFKHAHVMGLIGVCLDAGPAPYNIVMPYMANGSLLKYLKKERSVIVFSGDTDEDEVREFHYSISEVHNHQRTYVPRQSAITIIHYRYRKFANV